MRMDPPAIIDGSKDPQLIPDVVAWRLWFVSVALPTGASEAAQARRRVQLKAAGLKGRDITAAASAVATFKTSYDHLIGAYNDSIAEYHSTTHKPEVYNTIGGVRGWEAGSQVY
jgi:hypothetical protein